MTATDWWTVAGVYAFALLIDFIIRKTGGEDEDD